ncbi:hypothetical protein CRENBAI_003163 [Crenichthys baileyi]|uniref:Uncharacterized protein n=1 Tax=Crenichthys baileyi TaxID=28760 RepID=A0AAV9RZS5_9TELE
MQDLKKPDSFGDLDRTVEFRPTFLLLCVMCPFSSYTDEKADLATTRRHCTPADCASSPLLCWLKERG